MQITECRVELASEQQINAITVLYLIDCQECSQKDIESIGRVMDSLRSQNPIYYILFGSMNEAKLYKYQSLDQLTWEVLNSGTSFSPSIFDKTLSMLPDFLKKLG